MKISERAHAKRAANKWGSSNESQKIWLVLNEADRCPSDDITRKCFSFFYYFKKEKKTCPLHLLKKGHFQLFWANDLCGQGMTANESLWIDQSELLKHFSFAHSNERVLFPQDKCMPGRKLRT